MRQIHGECSGLMAEFVDGFEVLENVDNAVTIWGGARTHKDAIQYKKAVETGKLLVENGYAVITGGGSRNYGSRKLRRFFR
ncbi:MAG: hypothetical protein ACOX1Z_00275 [Candidatus Ratteibacteria bacterium]